MNNEHEMNKHPIGIILTGAALAIWVAVVFPNTLNPPTLIGLNQEKP